MNRNIITRLAVAAALLLTVNGTADAQLKGLVKGALGSKVNSSVGTATGTARKPNEYNQIQRAGGLDKFLGLDKTENGRILYKYYKMSAGYMYVKSESENGVQVADFCYDKNYDEGCVSNAVRASDMLVEALRWMAGTDEAKENYKDYARPDYALNRFNSVIPNAIELAKKTAEGKTPLPISDITALTEECQRIKQLYLAGTGVHEETAEEKKAKADETYIQNIVSDNYLLDVLRDKCVDAKKLGEYKPLVDKKVTEELAPTKILATYSTSTDMHGVNVDNDPALKEKYGVMREFRFKTYYEKDGKYYVVESAFRMAIMKGESAPKTTPEEGFWPGLFTPIEIPAKRIEGKF